MSRRSLLPVPLLLVLAALAAAPAQAHRAAAVPVGTSLTACRTALTQPERTATFAADMRVVPGAQRLAMRFTLQTRPLAGRAAWTAVQADGFGVWAPADRGVGRYRYEKTVVGLLAGAAYRTRVDFRWTTSAGRVVKRARRTSPTCTQPDLRADLRADLPFPEQADVAAGSPGVRYRIPVRNAGRTAAGPFAVQLLVGGVALEPEPVPGLAARERRDLVVVGPRCPEGGRLEVRVDVDDAVDERDEVRNVVTARC